MPRQLYLTLIAMFSLSVPSSVWAQDDSSADAPPTSFIQKLRGGRNSNEVARIEAEKAAHRAQLAQEEAQQRKTKDLLRAHEATLTRRRQANPGFRLRQVLTTIDIVHQDAKDAADDHRKRIGRLREERAKVNKEIAGLEKDPVSNRYQIGKREQVSMNMSEEMLMHSLVVDRFDTEIRLSQEADRITTDFHALAHNPRPTLKNIIATQQALAVEIQSYEDTTAFINMLNQQKEDVTANLQLTRAKLSQVLAEIELLDKKYDLTREKPIKLRISDLKIQKKVYEARIEFMSGQASALLQSAEIAKRLEELYDAEIHVLRTHTDAVIVQYWRRITMPLMAIAVIIIVYMLLSRLLYPILYQRDRLFTARRLSRYIMLAVLLAVILGFFFRDLKDVGLTVGLTAAAIVIVLQDLFSSFVGWFVIVASRKVRVGDRVEIAGHRGDVVDIQLLRTTILELNNWLEVDEPTGRVIVLPNSFIFKENVVNYSYIHSRVWNKVDVTVTFETPAVEAEALLRRVLEEETREEFEQAAPAQREMEQVYGVVDTIYEPKVFSIIADSGVTFYLLYVCHYRHISSVRNRINARIIKEFNNDASMHFAYPTQRFIPTAEEGEFKVDIGK